MKRRTLKKQIPHLAQQLLPAISKYLAASSRVHEDVLYSYQQRIEFGVVDLMSAHLILDPCWPHRERWLDGLGEEYSWERKSGVIHGAGELFWGHWPEVSREITGMRLNVVLKLCSWHGIEYQFQYGDNEVRRYSSGRWC